MARIATTEHAEKRKAAIAAFLTVNYGSGDGSGDGYGYGSGSGYGSGDGGGYGYGYGSGHGYGDGYGYGSGYGYGDGYGYGSGSGSGSGYGDGYGSGDGDGYGDGSGDGIAAFGADAVYMIDDTPTIIRNVHGNVASGAILRNDMTLQKCYIAKGGGQFAHGKTLREAQDALEAKILEDMPVEERIRQFMEKFKPGIEYPARQFYEWHHILTGSCEMGRKEFARSHGIDIDIDTFTPETFVHLTENAYGGRIIKALKAEFKKANQ